MSGRLLAVALLALLVVGALVKAPALVAKWQASAASSQAAP